MITYETQYFIEGEEYGDEIIAPNLEEALKIAKEKGKGETILGIIPKSHLRRRYV